MTAHIIGEAIFDVTFGPDREGMDVDSELAQIVQSRLLPIIEEVFDEMALDRETVPIDRLEVDLGPVRDDELESELAARLRERLRDALRDYVLARQKTVVVGKAPVSYRTADLDKLAYFLRYGHLTWNTSVGESHSVVDLLEEALLQSPNQISRLFEGSADFDTVVFRLASQFPENAVQDLVARLATADPALAARVKAALKTQGRERAGGLFVHSDAQGILRAYELYDQLRRQLTDVEAGADGNLGFLLEELQAKYPWQLLRLYRELQAGEGLSIRIPTFYGVEDLRRLVDAFLSVVEATTQSIADFRQSIADFAARSADKKAYYTQVLYRLIRNEVLDLEEFATHSAPAKDGGEVDNEDVESLLARHPARAREWFRRTAADPLALHGLIEGRPERWLLRLLHLLQESSAGRMLQAADAVIESAYAAGMKLPYSKVALLKWEFILSTAVSDETLFEDERFIDKLGQLISADIPQASREQFLSKVQDTPFAVAAQTLPDWDALIRAYDLYDLVLRKLEAKQYREESSELRTALQQLLERYPHHVRRLYRELQADADMLIRIQQLLSLADLAGLLDALVAVAYSAREGGAPLLEVIAKRASEAEDPRRYLGQVLQRLLRTSDADIDTLSAAPTSEDSDSQVLDGMRLLLEGRTGKILEGDLLHRFETILRDRPERAQRWLMEAMSGEQTSERAIHLLREPALLDVLRQFAGGRLAELIQAADAVADSLLAEIAPIPERELFRLKWAFLFRYAVRQGSDSEPEMFSAAFARYLEEHIIPVPERVRRIQLMLWDRSQPLDEPFLLQTLRSFEIPVVERLLLEADTAAHTFYRDGLILPQREIARLKWQMIFSDTLLEEADRHADAFAEHFEVLLRDRLAATPSGDLPVSEVSLPEALAWGGWVRAYELYDLLRRALVDGKAYSPSGLMAALEEALRLHPWQLLRLYREMRAGDGISVRVRDLYAADELRRLTEGLLALSGEPAETLIGIREAIAAFQPGREKDGDLRAYYFDVLQQLVQTGRPPAVASEFVSAALPEKVRWIQTRLRDRSRPLPERFLVLVLREIDSPTAERLLQTADDIVDSYYRAGFALPDREISRLKWEMIFSDALAEEADTHAAQLAEHLQSLIRGRLDTSNISLPPSIVAPAPVSAEFDWKTRIRAYELYDRLRQTLVDGQPDKPPGLLADLEEALRLYPAQLLRLYREMQAGDGLSDRLKDSYGAEGLRRITEVLLSVSEEDATVAIQAVAGFELDAEDLRLYYADVLEQLIEARRLPAPVAEFIAASLPEKVRWIQSRLRDRLQPVPERLLVQVLSEMDSAAIGGLLRTADSVADSYYRAAVMLPQREITRLKWQLIFSDALLEEPERHAAEFAEHFRFLLNERVDSVEEVKPQVLRSFEADWNEWIRAYELYDRLRWALVEGRPDSPSGLMAVLEETLRLHPWQLLRLYREMQAGDGLSARVRDFYGAGELQHMVEAFLTVSEQEPGAFDGLKESIAAFALQSKDQRVYYAAVLQQLVRAEVIDLEFAVSVSGEEQPLDEAPGLREFMAMAHSVDERSEPQLISLLHALREPDAAALLSAADAVLRSGISAAATLDRLDLIRLKWKFLLGYAIPERRAFDRTEFEAEFARFLAERSSEGLEAGELEASDAWQDLVRSYGLYEDLKQALLGTGAVRASIKRLVEDLSQTYPWQIRKLYRELESTTLQSGILRSRDADALRSLIEAFGRTVKLDPSLAAMIEQELAKESPDDAVQRYSHVLEELIRLRVPRESVAPSLRPSPPLDDARELIRVGENALRSGVERLQAWVAEMLSSGERVVRLLPEGLLARIFTTGAPASSPAQLLLLAERLAMAAASLPVGLSPQRARELKWMFVLRHGVVEKHSFVEAQFVRSFAAFIVSETKSPSAEALAAILAEQMKVDGMSVLVRQEEDKTHGAIELERGISVMNAGMVLAAPYLPRLFSELNLTEGRKFRDDEARERAVHLLQFMVNESEDTEEHELVLNKILCGMDTTAPIQRRVELVDREKVMIEGLIRGMIMNWKKLGQTSVGGFRESFLQREGTLRLADDTWQLEVLPKAFDVLLDYIPWTFETIKHPWMDRIVHVKWR